MSANLEKLNTPGFWYLASPYSHKNPVIREFRALDVQKVMARLMFHRINVYSPIWAAHKAAFDFELPKDHVFWLGFNKAFIDPADGIVVVMLDDWRESKGTAQEIAYALQSGKPVFYIHPATLDLTEGPPEP